MQIVAMTYADYEIADWPERNLVRRFRKWDAWATYHQARPALVLDEYVRRCVTVCVYDTFAEHAADIAILQTITDAPPPAGSSNGGNAPPAPATAALPIPLSTPRKPHEK